MPLAAEMRFVDRTKVLCEGKPLVFFGGTDYHRLSSHPEVIQAFADAAWAEGLSCAGSRVTTGNHPLLCRLEKRAAAFLGAGEVMVCASGYLANTVALESICADYQRFFVDPAAHASLSMAVDVQPRERVHPFESAYPEGLARELQRHLKPRERCLVLTDGVAPGNGNLPPLADYWEVIRNMGGTLLVDDSHGMGAVGATGKGAPEQAGLPAEAFVQTGTFAKALGVFGGMVAGPQGLSTKVIARSRAFVGGTPFPPPVAAAAHRSLDILAANPGMVTGLQARMAMVRKRVAALGLPLSHSPAPILSVTHGNQAKNDRFRAILLQHEIFPSYVNYPGCPPGGHFRFTFSSVHTDEEVECLLQAIALSC